jgi:hypothetical protein
MPSHSSCTYDEYSRDLLDSPDISQWNACTLDRDASALMFGFYGGVASISLNPQDATGVITTIDIMKIDEYTFELLVPIPPVCLRTVKYLTNSRNNDIIMCLSNFLQRNILFAMQGCVLCVNETSVSLYIPSSLKKLAYKDMITTGVECSNTGIFNGHSHHKIPMPSSLALAARRLFEESHKMRLTKDHKPMVTNGYEYFCKVTPILYVKAKSQKEDHPVRSNEPIEEISERRIVVRPLQFLECMVQMNTAQQ